MLVLSLGTTAFTSELLKSKVRTLDVLLKLMPVLEDKDESFKHTQSLCLLCTSSVVVI